MKSKLNRRRAYELRERMLSLGPPRVLVAEDDADVRALIATTLRSEGYSVIEAKDGMELIEQVGSALLFANVTGELNPVSLVISDIRMPGHTGLDVLAGLRRADVGIAVLLVSAYGDADTLEEAIRLGADAFVHKPFEIDVLLSVVRDLAPLPETGSSSPNRLRWA